MGPTNIVDGESRLHDDYAKTAAMGPCSRACTESVCETKDDGTSQTERERKRREFNDAERAETRGLSWWEQDDELTKHDAGC